MNLFQYNNLFHNDYYYFVIIVDNIEHTVLSNLWTLIPERSSLSGSKQLVGAGLHSLIINCACIFSGWVVSDSLQPQALQPIRLLCPWDFSRQEYWSGLHFLLQGVFPTQGWNPRSPALASAFFTSIPSGKPLDYQYNIVK